MKKLWQNVRNWIKLYHNCPTISTFRVMLNGFHTFNGTMSYITLMEHMPKVHYLWYAIRGKIFAASVSKRQAIHGLFFDEKMLLLGTRMMHDLATPVTWRLIQHYVSDYLTNDDRSNNDDDDDSNNDGDVDGTSNKQRRRRGQSP